jgi:hypothetical protein
VAARTDSAEREAEGVLAVVVPELVQITRRAEMLPQGMLLRALVALGEVVAADEGKRQEPAPMPRIKVELARGLDFRRLT